MDANTFAEQITCQLANKWNLHKTSLFSAYLEETFGVRPLDLPQFDCIYIAQAKEGDPSQGWIGGLILQWWVADDQGVRRIATPDLPLQPDAPENLRNGFYPRPVMKFFFSDMHITTGESFGPNYICRKYARVAIDDSGVVQFVETRILWNSSTLVHNAARK